MSSPGQIAGEGSLGSPMYLSDEKIMVFRIHNFKTLEKKIYVTTSVACHGYQWALSVYPWGEDGEAQQNKKISVYLVRVDSGRASVSVAFTFIIGSHEFPFYYTDSYTGTPPEFVEFSPSPNKMWGWEKLMDRSKAIQAVDKSGALTINVKIRCLLHKPFMWRPNHMFEGKLRELYNTKKGSDVSFVLGNGDIVRAHRFVLFAQCPALHDIVSEAADGSNIEIYGTDADLFATLIRFLYLEALPNDFDLKENGVELLKLADRFGCVHLKMHLEADLVGSDVLTVETAADFLSLADAHSCALLKEAAMDIVVANSAEVVKTKGWDTIKESGTLLSEVFQLQAEKAKGKDCDNVSVLRKRLAEADQDVDGTKEMLVKRCRTMKGVEQGVEAGGQEE